MSSLMRSVVAGVSLIGFALAVPGPALTQPEAVPPACLERLPTEPITLNLRDANVQTTLRLLAQQYKVNMLVTDEVTARVTLDFFRVPAREVFRAMIEAANLRCVEAGNVLRVSTAARLKAEDDERNRVTEARTRLDAETRKRIIEAQREEAEFDATKARGPIREVTVRLYYSDAVEVAATLQGILGLPPEGLTPPPAPFPGIYLPPGTTGGLAPAPPPLGVPPVPTVSTTTVPVAPDVLNKGLTIKAHKPNNSIFIRHYDKDVDRILRIIREELDIPQPQVQIAAQMVITGRQAMEQIGVAWGGAFLGTPKGDKGPAVVGRGFTTGTAGGTGVGPSVSTGNNPNFTGSELLPVSPTTGVGADLTGNLVNLPLSLLPNAFGGGAGFGALLGIVSKDFNLNLAIQALEVQGKARSVAAPNVVTVQNAEAVIKRGFEVPYTTVTGTIGVGVTNTVSFKEAVLELRVIPNVIVDETGTKIRMRIDIKNDEPDFTRAVLGNPPLFKRQAKTEVVVREGDRLVIGGIQLETAGNTRRQVPLLGDIPVLGWLFKSREISLEVADLIVILTPTVVAQAGSAARR
jgi:type IV pilus assembly protein PilQ